MLSPEKNERLTRVGPGTPMGELLRRYWWPVTFREPHEVVDLPMEKDKFGPAAEFRAMWCRESSIRFSPIRDEVLDLFGDPALA